MAKTSDCWKYYNNPPPQVLGTARINLRLELNPVMHWFDPRGEYYFEVDPVLVMPIVDVTEHTQVIVLLGRLIIRDKLMIRNLKGWLIENPMVPQ